MQVVLQTPSQLVVHDGRWTTVLMGAIFSAMGGGVMWLRWSHPTGWSGNGGAWIVYVVGTAFVAVGILIFWLSADRRYVVDRATRTVTMIVQRLVHRQITLLPFKDIDDVALEQSAGMSTGSNQTSSPTFRVVFLMKDGSRVPWTPYSTSARESQETSAAAARAFGGWAGNPEHQVQPVTATPALISHPVATNWGCLAAFLGIFVAAGLGIFSVQVYRIAMWQPVSARIVSSDVGTVRGSKGGVSYKPVVGYTYTYDGRPYTAYGVTPINISAGQSWARAMAARFRPASIATAYVNPRQPASAFLVREPSLMPLIFVLVPVLFGLLFSWIVRTQRRQVQLAEKHLVPVVNAMSLQQSR
jgi:hypothetical protein